MYLFMVPLIPNCLSEDYCPRCDRQSVRERKRARERERTTQVSKSFKLPRLEVEVLDTAFVGRFCEAPSLISSTVTFWKVVECGKKIL